MEVLNGEQPTATAGGRRVRELLDALRLVDHHCHGVVADDLSAAEFEALISEGGHMPGTTNFDTPVGVSIRRHCAPLLDLPQHVPAAAYLARRAELGWREVNRRFLTAARTAVFCVDTGFAPVGAASPARLAHFAGGAAYEIVRLESIAEDVARAGIEPNEYAENFRNAVHSAVRERGAVGLKSIAAYRTGLDLDPRRPTEAEVCEAARRWFRRIQPEDAPGAWRVTDPVIIRHGLWTAVDLGLPLQLHTGFGDRDITLHRADPSQLTDWLREVNGQIPVLLLHCWPFHRQAAFLAAVLPNVYFDLGLTMHYVGPARARVIVGEAMEMAPFHKLLYSSDAYGVAEFYYLSAVAFRQGLGEHLQDAVDDGDLSGSDAVRIAAMVGRDNALRVYGLPSRAD